MVKTLIYFYFEDSAGDFQRAFDKVDHTILLKKLPNFGITEKLLDWLANYMIGNSMCSF